MLRGRLSVRTAPGSNLRIIAENFGSAQPLPQARPVPNLKVIPSLGATNQASATKERIRNTSETERGLLLMHTSQTFTRHDQTHIRTRRNPKRYGPPLFILVSLGLWVLIIWAARVLYSWAV